MSPGREQADRGDESTQRRCVERQSIQVVVRLRAATKHGDASGADQLQDSVVVRIRSMNASILLSRPEISIIICSSPTSTIRPRKMSTSSRISVRLPPGGWLNLQQHQVAFDVAVRADVVTLTTVTILPSWRRTCSST